MYLCNWVFCIQINKTLLQCQKLTDQSIKSITHFFLLIYLTFLHLSCVLCLLWLHITAQKKMQLLYSCLLSARWEEVGTKGETKPLKFPFVCCFQFKTIKRREKCLSKVQHTVFPMSHPRQESWMRAMPLASVWGHTVPSPLCCHNRPVGAEWPHFSAMTGVLSASPWSVLSAEMLLTHLGRSALHKPGIHYSWGVCGGGGGCG